MTLTKIFLAAVMLASSMAQAVVIPNRPGDNYGPIRPGPGNGNGPVRPRPEFPNYGGRTEEVYINRYVRNESINLFRQVAHLRGYRVESVRVYIDRARNVNSSLDLVLNNRAEDSRRAEVGRPVVLTPRNFLEIGRHLNDLRVNTRGEMLINRIVIELSSETSNNPTPPPHYGEEISVPLRLPSYLPPQPRLDLTPYIDTFAYRGYRIVGVEIVANSRNFATMEILLNGYFEGQMNFTQQPSRERVRSRQNLVIGSSFGNLVVVPRGDSNIIEVSLILSRH